MGDVSLRSRVEMGAPILTLVKLAADSVHISQFDLNDVCDALRLHAEPPLGHWRREPAQQKRPSRPPTAPPNGLKTSSGPSSAIWKRSAPALAGAAARAPLRISARPDKAPALCDQRATLAHKTNRAGLATRLVVTPNQ